MFAGPLARVVKLSCTLNHVYPAHNIGFIHEETYFKYQSPYYRFLFSKQKKIPTLVLSSTSRFSILITYSTGKCIYHISSPINYKGCKWIVSGKEGWIGTHVFSFLVGGFYLLVIDQYYHRTSQFNHTKERWQITTSAPHHRFWLKSFNWTFWMMPFSFKYSTNSSIR